MLSLNSYVKPNYLASKYKLPKYFVVAYVASILDLRTSFVDTDYAR